MNGMTCIGISQLPGNNYRIAQSNWIWLQSVGDLIPQNFGSSMVVWLREAAERGYAMAQFYLGILYQYGRYVTQDYKKAADWYQQAA